MNEMFHGLISVLHGFVLMVKTWRNGGQGERVGEFGSQNWPRVLAQMLYRLLSPASSACNTVDGQITSLFKRNKKLIRGLFSICF